MDPAGFMGHFFSGIDRGGSGRGCDGGLRAGPWRLGRRAELRADSRPICGRPGTGCSPARCAGSAAAGRAASRHHAHRPRRRRLRADRRSRASTASSSPGIPTAGWSSPASPRGSARGSTRSATSTRSCPATARACGTSPAISSTTGTSTARSTRPASSPRSARSTSQPVPGQVGLHPLLTLLEAVRFTGEEAKIPRRAYVFATAWRADAVPRASPSKCRPSRRGNTTRRDATTS